MKGCIKTLSNVDFSDILFISQYTESGIGIGVRTSLNMQQQKHFLNLSNQFISNVILTIFILIGLSLYIIGKSSHRQAVIS